MTARDLFSLREQVDPDEAELLQRVRGERVLQDRRDLVRGHPRPAEVGLLQVLDGRGEDEVVDLGQDDAHQPQVGEVARVPRLQEQRLALARRQPGVGEVRGVQLAHGAGDQLAVHVEQILVPGPSRNVYCVSRIPNP